jgi:hypothetical protein
MKHRQLYKYIYRTAEALVLVTLLAVLVFALTQNS